MSNYKNYYRIFRFMATGNFIKNPAQELYWKQKAGDPNHYYELVYKSNIDNDFLIKYGNVKQKEIDMGGVIDSLIVLTMNSYDLPSGLHDSENATRKHVGFAISGYIKHTLTDEEVRLLKLKDYNYFQELINFELEEK